MSAFYDFMEGASSAIKDQVDAKLQDDREVQRWKRQEEIREEARKKAEATRVAARQIVRGGSPEDGPQQLLVESYNEAGDVLESRPARQDEKEASFEAARTRATNLAAAQTEANRAAAKEARAEEAHASRLLTDKSSRESASAYRANLAKPSGGTEDEAELMKEINRLTSDPVIREAIAAGDPQALQEFGPPDLGAVDSAIRKYGKMLGGKMADEDRPTVLASLSNQQDPAIRIKTLQMYLRRLRQAEASGLSQEKGIRPRAVP